MGAKRDVKALRKRVAKLETQAGDKRGKTAVSPLAPTAMPALAAVEGARFASAAAGIRYKDRRDVTLIELCPGTVMAGCFTRSSTRAAPVLDCEAKIRGPSDAGAAILVNAGNANAFTGGAGREAVARVTGAVAEALGIPAARVFSSSTGVIGEPLPFERITAVVDELKAALDPAGMTDAARAIMTTDTFAKAAVAEVALPGGTVRIAGIAKGSGMVAPDMATMLVYIVTDARIAREPLQRMTRALTRDTFNAITVDGDTSTSDTLLVAATGKAAADPIKGAGSPEGRAFRKALGAVMLDLAQQVVRDGEGATKFIEVRVTGAASGADARRVALAIANSPLVKTAAAGEDPNWGRIVMAVGKSGAVADRDRLSIRLGEVLVAENGWRAPAYREEQGAAYMKRAELVFAVDLGIGRGRARVWTCDLTHRYIDINADYRS